MFLLDTNVISELRKVRKNQVHANFAAWSKTLHWPDLYLSAITIHELGVGIARLAEYDAIQSKVLSEWLHDKVLAKFESRVLPVDTAVATYSAQLQVTRTRSLEDTLIAATAYVHRMKMVTRNVGDFADTGVQIINPWDS